MALPARYGGLELKVYTNISNHEYGNSRKITKELTNYIFQQDIEYNVNVDNIKKIKSQLQHEKNERFRCNGESIRNVMSEKQQRLNGIKQEKGVSNWLTVLPISEHGFNLNKQQFWDCIRLIYGWNITNLRTTCACGSKFDLQHCMSCKNGGFIKI